MTFTLVEIPGLVGLEVGILQDLEGKGGPYRLDAGHDVYQIPQEEKDAVPDEVKRAAREMGLKAFKERFVISSSSYVLST